jgi:Papain-like cysteine protease AvrRpt2
MMQPVLGPVQICRAGLSGMALVARRANSLQEMQNWCWAACIQAVFAWYGHNVAQDAIVSAIFGSRMDRAATTQQMLYALNARWRDSNSGVFQSIAQPLIDSNFSFNNPNAAALMSQDLINNRPLIVGTQGHATVLTAMSWANSNFGQRITSLTVRDPWPLNPNWRPLSASEFANIGMLLQIRVS